MSNIFKYSIAVAALLAGQNNVVAAADTRCASFIIGNWSAKGVFRGMGTPIRIDHRYAYQADGRFSLVTRYLGRDGKWVQQPMSGRWTAADGTAPRSCKLTMASVSAHGSASSTAEFSIIGKDTYRSLGFDVKRVRAR